MTTDSRSVCCRNVFSVHFLNAVLLSRRPFDFCLPLFCQDTCVLPQQFISTADPIVEFLGTELLREFREKV